MENLSAALGSTIRNLSEGTYDKSFADFQFWFKIGRTYSRVPPDLILDTICRYRSWNVSWDNLFSPTAHLIPKFVTRIESDPILAPHSAGLRSRFCSRIVHDFFDTNMDMVYNSPNDPFKERFYKDVNIIAHCIKSGYIEEDTVRDRILQSLTLYDKLLGHQVDALIILFWIAGATFGACVDPETIDRCFELLKDHPGKKYKGAVQVSSFSLRKRSRD